MDERSEAIQVRLSRVIVVLAFVALGFCVLGFGPASARGHRHNRVQIDHDLTGLWTNASYTHLQRPKVFKALVITPQEARAYESTLVKTHGVRPDPDDQVGQVDTEFNDSGTGLARIGGQIRTSWIIDPADGRIPYTAEARKRLDARDEDHFDNPEELDASARCLYANGSAPPQMSAMDTNLVQIVQTADYVGLLSEKNHEVRIIPLNRKRSQNEPANWSGNSIGHWEGKTLVVETKGFRDALVDRFFFTYSSAAVIEERFTRTSTSEILYEFTVSDPTMFTQVWRGEELFTATKGPLYEFACHEGNYSLPGILAAARQGRQGPAPATQPKPSLPPPTPVPLSSGHG